MYRKFGKRLIDIVGSIFGLVVLSIPLILISLYLLLKEGKQIFYWSERVGKAGVKFKMLKFRTMSLDAEQQWESLSHLSINGNDKALVKIPNDPRVHKTGKILRKYAIDELPQFVNVLLGDMSIVGPRPLLVKEVELQGEKGLQRISVNPGMTGLWQISGRSNIEFNTANLLDLKYINNLSLFNDIKIMFKTVLVMIKGSGSV